MVDDVRHHAEQEDTVAPLRWICSQKRLALKPKTSATDPPCRSIPYNNVVPPRWNIGMLTRYRSSGPIMVIVVGPNIAWACM